MVSNVAILDGVTVLEVGTFLTAPKPARFLAEFGAEVIKVERTTGGPFRQPTPHGDPIDGVTALQTIINSGKKSIALDISMDKGHEIFLRLARDADIMIENMGPGATERLGIAYEDVAKINNDIVYCSISGYGNTGPWRGRKAVDFMAQGMSGLPFQNEQTSDGGPALTGWFVADELTAAYATIAIMGALIGNKGTHIDIGMFDVMLGAFSDKAAAYSSDSTISPPGTPVRVEGPRGMYHTATKPITVDVIPRTEERWQQFWETLGFDNWIESGRFSSTAAIHAEREYVEKRVAERFKCESQEYWLEQLWDADFIAAPVLTVEEAFEHEQTKARPAISNETDKRIGDYLQQHFPAVFSAYDVEITHGTAGLGEHTRELLERAGYSTEEINTFYEKEVIV